MQRVGLSGTRRHTDNSTSMEKREDYKRPRETQRSFRSIHSQSQLEKQKFAQEYAKLTNQFRKILSKGSTKGEHRGLSQPQATVYDRKQVSIGKQEKQKQNSKAFSQQKEAMKETMKSRKTGRLQQRHPRLQNLYSNKLHYDILETASRLQRNKKQKVSPTQISPLSSHHSIPQISLHTPNSAQSQSTPNPFASPPPNPQIDRQLFVHLEQQKNKKINPKFAQIPETLAHFHNLYKIYELLQNYKNSYSTLIKNIKKYVMNYNKADIAKLEGLLKINGDREKLKVFLCFEKVAVLGVLDAMIRGNQVGVISQGKAVLEVIFGVYLSIFAFILNQSKSMPKDDSSKAQSQHLESLQLCYELLESQQIQKRKDLQSTLQFLLKKMQSLYRSNQPLFHKIKQLLSQIPKITLSPTPTPTTILINYSNSININRFFYFLLCEYAHWMNCGENVQILKVHRNVLDFFVTCPAPHLGFAGQEGRITVVLQLEGTLASVKFSTVDNSKISIKLRPHAMELIKSLHEQAQLVIMTSLLPQNLPISSPIGQKFRKMGHRNEEPYQQMLKLCSCVLFKHHYVRYRGLLVKDMSRLGRKLQQLILVDDINYGTLHMASNDQSKGQQNQRRKIIVEHNTINERNTIPISTWKGNSKDEELLYLKQLLSNIIAQQPEDVRDLLATIKDSKGERENVVEEESQSKRPSNEDPQDQGQGNAL